MKYFLLAKRWSVILLIDEADIYMEYRQVQDLERNNLVAVFLRAMEYCQGILFLTTNRVGHFDEAFISRISISVYYKPFGPEERKQVWENFFEKLETEREDQMRIHSSTRDYIKENSALAKLEWNGREIRNGKRA
jgi:SpoVK/Ycf46/Vps4 family AAA+-type ATPase